MMMMMMIYKTFSMNIQHTSNPYKKVRMLCKSVAKRAEIYKWKALCQAIVQGNIITLFTRVLTSGLAISSSASDMSVISVVHR